MKLAAPLTICLSDRMSDRFSSTSEFMESMVTSLNDEWRRKGSAGCRLVALTWENGTASLETRAGPDKLTVDIVRAALPKRSAAA